MKHMNLKMFLGTLLTIFNLGTCGAATYAWFITARSNNASGFNVQMYTHELDMSYRVYKYDEELGHAINATGRPDALALPEYDSVITDRNAHTPVILEFVVTGMNLGEGIPLHIKTECGDSSTNSRSLSNIVQLRFSPISVISATDAQTIYNSAVNYFADPINAVPAQCFKVGSNKELEIVYNLTDYDSELSDGALRIFVELDYSVALVSQFEFEFGDETTTSFDNDITWISCYTDGITQA